MTEIGIVAIPILQLHLRRNCRNLIYTAITRAKTRVVVIGEKEVLYTAIRNSEANKRNTSLAKMIRYFVNLKGNKDLKRLKKDDKKQLSLDSLFY